MYGPHMNREGPASGCFFVAKDLFLTSLKYVLDSVMVLSSSELTVPNLGLEILKEKEEIECSKK